MTSLECRMWLDGTICWRKKSAGKSIYKYLVSQDLICKLNVSCFDKIYPLYVYDKLRVRFGITLVWWHLFLLYHDIQFYWFRKKDYQEKTTDLPKGTEYYAFYGSYVMHLFSLAGSRDIWAYSSTFFSRQ